MPPESPVPGWSSGDVWTLTTAMCGRPLTVWLPPSRWRAEEMSWIPSLMLRTISPTSPEPERDRELPDGLFAAEDRRVGEGPQAVELVGMERPQLCQGRQNRRR